MELNDVLTMISNFGVSIAGCVAMGLFIYKTAMYDRKTVFDREERLRQLVQESNDLNRELSATNANFVKILDNYTKDLSEIKEDIDDIKVNVKSLQSNDVVLVAPEKKRQL